MDIKEDLILWFINFFDKKSAGSGIGNDNDNNNNIDNNNNNNDDDIKQNNQLAKELHKPIIRKLKKKVFFWIKDIIWSADLADM